jgi:hypothetical protein
MSGIVWLASYPKSGNTWLRVFLANFQRDDGRPVDINALASGSASNRELFDSAFGVESSDMTAEEIERYRPQALRWLARQRTEILNIKIHDAYLWTSACEPLIPADVTRGVIYVARNPLDLVISFAHHFTISLEEAISRLGSETSLGAHPDRLKAHVRQRLLSWSGHVLSWLDQQVIPVHLMRYEDMSVRPVETFREAVRFLGWTDDVDRVRRAVAFSSFETLRRQEQAKGFKERYGGTAFFREGRTDAWREVLTEEQVSRVVGDHGPVMRRLGYLPENGRIERSQ